MRRAWPGVTALVLALAGCSARSGDHGGAPAGVLVVRRGDLEETRLLSGTLRAVDSAVLSAPRPRRWNWLSVRRMEEEGTYVTEGQVVLEFDNSEYVSQLDELELALVEAENRLARTRADNAVVEADKQHAVAAAENLLGKAKISAEVPAGVLSQREHQERQLALEQAQVALAKAQGHLAAQRTAAALAEDIEKIALDTARRDIEAARHEIDAFTLRAPRSGILIVKENMREHRKVKVGDRAWPGMGVMELPDLSRMYVEASLADVDDGGLTVGMPATCVLDAFSDLVFEGRIRDVSPVAQSEEKESLRRMFKVGVELSRTDAERMRPGMSVKVVAHGRAAKGALIAPRAGLDVARSLAYPADGGERAVDIDWCNAHACVIRAGLAEGEALRGAQ